MAGALILTVHAPHTYQRRFTTADVEAVLGAAHLYIVTRGPAVRMRTVFAVDDHTAAYVMQCRDKYERRALAFAEPLKPRLGTKADGAYWVLRDGTGALRLHGSAWALAATTGGDGFLETGLRRQEVVYVGRAYGNSASGAPTSNAHKRLSSHSTLQRIYEDHANSGQDILVTPLVLQGCDMTPADTLPGSAPSFSYDKWIDSGLVAPWGNPAEGHLTALAEEALIAYFKPEYNINLRHWGSTTTSSARAVLDVGVRVLALSLESWGGLTDFY